MKETMKIINSILSILGIGLMIIVAVGENFAKDELTIVTLVWLYVLCNYLSLKED